MRRLAFLVGALGAGACVDVPPPSCEDFDLDGWSCATAPDCDERDAEVHPGALELCGNGIDEDCSGADVSCESSIRPLVTTSDNERIEVRLDASSGNEQDFQVELDGDFGYALTSLIQGSTEILFDQDHPLRGAGVALAPDAAQWQAPGNNPTIVHGAALVHNTSRWALGNILGFAHVTIFPDGRIHRSDQVTLDSARVGTALGPYASFDESFDSVTWRSLGTTVSVEVPYRRELPVGQTGWICAFDTFFAQRAVMLWATDPDNPAAPTIDAEFGRFTLSYDWQRGVTSVEAGTYRARTMLLATQVSSDNPNVICDADDALAQLESPAPLTIHIGAPYDEDPVDGDGYDAEAGIYAVTGGDNGDHVEVEIGAGGVPGPGFGMRVELHASQITVWRDGVRLEHGRDYLAQVDNPSNYYATHHIYVKRPPGGIPAGTRYWIAGPGAEPP